MIYPLVEVVPELAMFALLVWGFFVIADSAQFSAISSESCPTDMVGSALAIKTASDFSIDWLHCDSH